MTNDKTGWHLEEILAGTLGGIGFGYLGSKIGYGAVNHFVENASLFSKYIGSGIGGVIGGINGGIISAAGIGLIRDYLISHNEERNLKRTYNSYLKQ